LFHSGFPGSCSEHSHPAGTGDHASISSVPASTLSNISSNCFRGIFAVTRLTTGTITSETTIATAPIFGATAGSILYMIAPPSDTAKPPIKPAHAPAFVVPFQYSPYRNGARNAPATVPHEKDISARMELGVTATMNEHMTNSPHNTLIRSITFSFFMFGKRVPFTRSSEIAELDTSTSDERVNIDAESTSRTMIP